MTSNNYVIGVVLICVGALIVVSTIGRIFAQEVDVSGGSKTVLPSSTVSALPTCNAASLGSMFIVTNALLPTALATVAGGGVVTVGVLCNGTNYIVN